VKTQVITKLILTEIMFPSLRKAKINDVKKIYSVGKEFNHS